MTASQLLPLIQPIEAERLEIQRRIELWANINTHSYNLTGIQKVQELLFEDFSKLAQRSERISLGPNIPGILSFKKRPKAKLQLLLGGHIDTVYSKDHPFQRVAYTTDGKMVGPGVADMKGGLAILLFALEAFERSPFASSAGWEVIINADEEIGSQNSAAYLEKAAEKAHYGLWFEPALPSGGLVLERPGSYILQIEASGKSAHVGRNPEEGRSAIHALAEFISKVSLLQNLKEGLLVNVGLVKGGTALNVVADYAEASLNLRAPLADSMKALKHQVSSLIKKVEQNTGVTFSLTERTARPPKPLDKKTEKLFNLYQEGCLAIGATAKRGKSGGVCDGNILAAKGLSTLDTLGVVGGNLHSPEEYLLLDSLTQRSQLATLLMMRLAMGK